MFKSRDSRWGAYTRRNGRRLGGRGDSEVDRSLFGGLFLSFSLIAVGIISSGRGLQFFDIGSALIVLGGTFGASLVHYSVRDIKDAWQALKSVASTKGISPSERARALMALAQQVRTEGVLVLERAAERTSDPFFRMGLELAVDGQDAQEIRRVLELEMRAANERAERSAKVFETMGGYAPAMGLIGTLLGLIQMLGSLDNPATVGPSMAVALVTTLYGAMMANLVCLPIAGKLRGRQDEGVLLKALSIEGIVSIARQENSMMLEQKLQSFNISHQLFAATR